MKTTMNLKSLMMLGVMCLLAVSVSAQRIHKHPRVTVKANKGDYKRDVENKVENQNISTTAVIVNEDNYAKAENDLMSNETEFTSISEDNKEVIQSKKQMKKEEIITNINTSINSLPFVNNLLNHTKLFKVREVKKIAMEKWLLIMIILFSAAFLFLLLAIIFAVISAGTSGTSGTEALAWICWLLFGLCLTGGVVVLVLGLVGVI